MATSTSRKKSTARKNSTQDDVPLIVALLIKAVSEIQKYSKSNTEEDRFVVFNVLLTIFSLTMLISEYISPGSSIQKFNIGVLIIVVFSLIFAVIVGYFYLIAIDIISNAISKDLFALKTSVGLMFLVSALSFIGFWFGTTAFGSYAFGLILVELVALIFFGFIYKVPVKAKLEQQKEEQIPSITIWNILDKISIILGILSFIITIVSIIWSYIPK